MRKKWYFVSVIIILGLLLAAYYVTGIKAEKEFHHFLKSANALPNVKVTAENYQRGWFKSTTHLNVVLHCPPQQYEQNGEVQTVPAQDVPLSFELDLYHGPIIFANHQMAFGLGSAQASVPLPSNLFSQLSESLVPGSKKPIFTISLLLHYTKTLDVNLKVPAFVLSTSDNQVQVNWKGFEGNWILSHKLSHIEGSVLFRGITFKDGNAMGQVGITNLDYDVRNRGAGLLSGKAAVGLQMLHIIVPNSSTSIMVKGLQATSESKIKQHNKVKLVDSTLKADVQEVIHHGLHYGPGVFSVSLFNLNADALQSIQEKMQASNNDNLTEAQQQIFMLTLLPDLSQLLANGAKLEVKHFEIAIPQGLIMATAEVGLPVQENSNQNPLQLLQQLRANLMAEVPVSWLSDRLTDFIQVKMEQRQTLEKHMEEKGEKVNKKDDAPSLKNLSLQDIQVMAKQQALMQLQTLVQNGVLIQKENVYQMKVTFENGGFFVNGKPFNNQQIEGVNNDSTT